LTRQSGIATDHLFFSRHRSRAGSPAREPAPFLYAGWQTLARQAKKIDKSAQISPHRKMPVYAGADLM
jgi:hypothetical protein